jgi:hypothetical protein
MEWWWNEYIYIGIWFVIILSFILGISLSPRKEDSFLDINNDDIDLQALFQPYHIKEVCTLYGPVYDSIVLSFKPLEGQAARDEADKEVKKHVPGGHLNCSIALPSSKEPQDIFNFLSGLSDTYLADIYATLLFTVSTLQSTLNQIQDSLTKVPPTPPPGKVFESYEDVCSPQDAAKKRAAQIPTCLLPEDVSPEALTTKSKEKIARLKSALATYKTKNIEAPALVELSFDDLLKKGKDLSQQVQALKKKLESGDVSPPQSESFVDGFTLQFA